MGLDCGFDAVGFASAGPVDEVASTHFRNWIGNGRHASMHYMTRREAERLDPRLIMPGVRSVVAVLSNYYRENPTESLSVGKISRYAGGRDYHKVLGNWLRSFTKKLVTEFPTIQVWHEADTGPVLERYWAERAGLGWIGKNTMLIHKTYGSWIFLGVLLTSLPLTPDNPHPAHCGSCTRCLEACPTRALCEPGLLDSRRCISDWTVEHRGEFPDEVGRNLNGWFFGCDDCQTVCPWNRKAKITSLEDHQLREGFCVPDLPAWAVIKREEWDRLTRGTAIRRAGHEGFRRNSRHLLASCFPGTEPGRRNAEA